MCRYIHTYIYIYIYREREIYVSIYIYIERERDYVFSRGAKSRSLGAPGICLRVRASASRLCQCIMIIILC